MSRPKMVPPNPARNDGNQFERFQNFMRHLVAVPHSKIKAELDAEKQAKSKLSSFSRARGGKD